MQIVAQGAQDKYLTVDPEITFFKSMYRRHTNFAVESIEQTFNGTVGPKGKVSATISRNGDLVHRMWLELTLPALAESHNTPRAAGDAYAAIDNISIEIGGTRVDRHYGDWMKIRDELMHEHGKRGHLFDDTTGGVTEFPKVANTVKADELKVRIPLSFWFCKDAGQALPLIALQYHEVKVNVEFKATGSNSDGSTGFLADTKASLWVDYIYLDTAERQRFARSQHEYLIEQVQTTNKESISGATDKIRLNFNHPVKELIWTAYGSSTSAKLSASNYDKGLKLAKLKLNGHDRFAERDAAYFNKVQQYQHHSGQSDAYVYSFALDPEKLQPSGTCNFSRIDNAELELTMEDSTYGGEATVYAVNYNVLRIKNGMGGLAYSN